MGQIDALDRGRLAEVEIERLLEQPSTQIMVAEAARDWVDFMVRGTEPHLPDAELLRTGWRISVLGRLLPGAYSPQRDVILGLIDGLAEAVDIYSRFDGDRSEVLTSLATRLYGLALQPTKMWRASRALSSHIGGEEGAWGGVIRELAGLGGAGLAERVAQKLAGLAEGGSADTGDAFDRLFEETRDYADAEGHARAIELGFMARLRRSLDLPTVVGDDLSQTYVQACIQATGSAARTELLPAQRWAIERGLLQRQTVAITTPTGSGKTFMAELRIARELTANPQALCVYVAPFNALATQVREQLQVRLARAGWQVRLWTGAYELAESDLDLGSVLVTTPEKLDFILRSALEGETFAEDLRSRLRLVVLDEAHMVETGVRGIRYEFLIMRVRRLFPEVGIISMSAVHATAESFATWLQPDGAKRSFLPLNWRPTLTWDVLWRTDGNLEGKHEGTPIATLARPSGAKEASALLAAQLLLRLRSVLLVETRKDWAESLARFLFEQYYETLEGRLERNSASQTRSRDQLEDLSAYVGTEIHPEYPLVKYLKVGLAFHHAGLPSGVRRRVEQLARQEAIHTVVATTTLAEGVDLPFRAVILAHLNVPFGRLSVSALNNIRGRAGRPFYANDGAFFVIEPEKKNTDTYQYFKDHFWEESVAVTPLGSALPDLSDWSPFVRSEARRAMESQLLAYLAENPTEPDEVDSIAEDTFLANVIPLTDRRLVEVAGFFSAATREMLESESPLLQAASPLELTPLGKRVALGGLSAQSGWLVRSQILAHRETWQELLESRGPTWLAVRLAWLPWEACEHSAAYRSARGDPRRSVFARAIDAPSTFSDSRLESEYALSELLLEPRTFRELAEDAASKKLLSGRTVNDKLVSAIEWSSNLSGVLSWTYTGALRIADLLSAEWPGMEELIGILRPYVGYFQSWVPSAIGTRLTQDGILDRDSAVRLARAVPESVVTYADLAEWGNDHRTEIDEVLGASASTLHRVIDAIQEEPTDSDTLPPF